MDLIETSSIQMWVTFGVIFCAVILYSLERWSLEMISIGVVVSLIFYARAAKKRAQMEGGA